MLLGSVALFLRRPPPGSSHFSGEIGVGVEFPRSFTYSRLTHISSMGIIKTTLELLSARLKSDDDPHAIGVQVIRVDRADPKDYSSPVAHISPLMNVGGRSGRSPVGAPIYRFPRF